MLSLVLPQLQQFMQISAVNILSATNSFMTVIMCKLNNGLTIHGYLKGTNPLELFQCGPALRFPFSAVK